MKKLISIIAISVLVPLSIFAATTTYKVKSGDTWESVAATNHITVQQLADLNPLASGQRINVPAPVTPPTPTSTPPAPTSTPPSSGEIRFTAYNTFYGYPDNTPPNSADIALPVIHSQAGGTGTYADPITAAVGHVISGGKDTPDYPAGTKFYVPDLRRYFIVEDLCGDGNNPQNGPCHKDTDHPGVIQIDLWVGGVGQNANPTIACEDALTGLHLMIEHPAPNYAVVSGQIFNGSCSQEYGDAVVTL